jgi:hypothetical protein
MNEKGDGIWGGLKVRMINRGHDGARRMFKALICSWRASPVKTLIEH